MPESSNIEIAHKLAEHRDAESPKQSWHDLVIEILEAVLLGIVAVATAWSAYNAAKWDGHSAELYAQASTLRIEGDQLVTLGGQQRLLDVSTFNTWIQARNEGNEKLAALYVRRFSTEFKVAFDAWLKTNPFSNPNAPAMPQQPDSGVSTFRPSFFKMLFSASSFMIARWWQCMWTMALRFESTCGGYSGAYFSRNSESR